MSLRQRIENILLNSYMAIGIEEFRQDILDEIMNEITKKYAINQYLLKKNLIGSSYEIYT